MDTTTAWKKASDLQQPLQDKETLRRDQALIGRQDRIQYHHHRKDQKEKRNIVNPHLRSQVGKRIVLLSHIRTQKVKEIVTILNIQKEVDKIKLEKEFQHQNLGDGHQKLSSTPTSNTMEPTSHGF